MIEAKGREKGIFSYLHELNEFNKSENASVFKKLNEHRQVILILRLNYQELSKYVKYHNLPETVSRLVNNINSNFRYKAQRNIIRLLSNYLGSIFWVVNYFRKNVKRFEGKGIRLEEFYNKEKKVRFEENEIHRFLQDLRDHSMHVSYLNIGSEFGANKSSKKFESKIYLKKEELGGLPGLHKLTKKFICSQEDHIYIMDIIEYHFKSFIEFQNWCYLAFIHINKDLILKHKEEAEAIWMKAKKVKMEHTLYFNQSYFKYIDLILRKSEQL
jgi:hypothetical protein